MSTNLAEWEPPPRTYGRLQCVVAGCEEPHECKGLCNKHYIRFRKKGSPFAGRDLRKRGTGSITNYGYVAVGSGPTRKLQHVIVAERALGRELPEGAQVHHIDGNRANNRNDNLVICPSQAYHTLLHMRERALLACGHPNYRRCLICKCWDDPSAMRTAAPGSLHHLSCRRKRDKERKYGNRQAI